MRTGMLAITALVGLLLPTAATAQPFGAWMIFTPPTFDGYVEVPHSPALNPTSELTLEAWVVDLGTAECKTVAGKDFTRSYGLGVCGSTLRSYTRGTASEYNAGTVTPFEWTHVAVVYDGATRRHYVNGELVGSRPESGVLPASTAPLRLGGDVSWPISPKVAMDEVRLWRVARTTSQIRHDLNVSLAAPTPGLVAVWRLDGDGQDALGAHHGTVHGDAGFLTFPVAAGCSPTPTSLCLHGRFAVSVSWRDFMGGTGTGSVVPCGSSDSGLFWFFNSANWELLVKVLNGCSLNNRWWIFSAATTNVFYRLEVFDVVRGANKIYFNYLGESAPAVTDPAALATCP